VKNYGNNGGRILIVMRPTRTIMPRVERRTTTIVRRGGRGR
jgi:hypothetical protein